MSTVDEAKAALDSLVTKSRAHLYKPMQIAEILRTYSYDNYDNTTIQ